MKDEAPEWATAVGVLLLVLLLGSLALIAAGGWPWFARFLESAAPAWVQALGAVVAIVAAFLIGERQARASARVAEAAESRRIKSIFAIAEAAANCAQRALDSVSEGGVVSVRFFSEYHESILNSHAQALGAVPVHELGEPAAVTAMLGLREQLFFLRDSIEKWQVERRKARASDEGLSSNFDTVRAGNVRTHVNKIRQHLGEMRAALFIGDQFHQT